MTRMSGIAVAALAALAIAAVVLMDGLAAPASADSMTCPVQGFIMLSPGLSEQPQMQTIRVSAVADERRCSEVHASFSLNATLTTAEPATCAALAGPGASSSTSSRFRVSWGARGLTAEGHTKGSFSMPLSEISVSLGGMATTGKHPEREPFHEDQISGTLRQEYRGGNTCGVPSRRGKLKPVRLGTIHGSIAFS